MFLSYQGYLRLFRRKDSLDTFDDFIRRCLKRDLKPIERQEVSFVYNTYRFANDYRLEVKENG